MGSRVRGNDGGGRMDEVFAARLIVEARGLAGVPFRLHGRSERGLDCVGVVALAALRAGYRGVAPRGYSLRGGRLQDFRTWLHAAGLEPVADMRAGDVVLARVGPGQWHLMLRVEGGFVHAHAGLRRVVEMPGDCPWAVEGIWRFPDFPSG